MVPLAGWNEKVYESISCSDQVHGGASWEMFYPGYSSCSCPFSLSGDQSQDGACQEVGLRESSAHVGSEEPRDL